MHDRKHLCHLGKARGRIELSMIVTYFQCLTLRVRSGHLSNALTRERSWLTEKLVSPPYQSQSVVDSFIYYKNTLQWPHFGPTVQPLGDPWTKWSQRTGSDNFFLLFYFIIFFSFFFFRTQVARNKTSGYTVTKNPPVTPLWANSTTVRRPLGKMKPKDWFRQFFLFHFILFFSFFFFGLKLWGIRHLATRLQNTLQWPHSGPTVQPLGDPWAKWSQRTGLDIFSFLYYFRTQVARNKTFGYHGYKETLQWSHFEPTVQRLGRPLDKLRPKDWFRHLTTSTFEKNGYSYK